MWEIRYEGKRCKNRRDGGCHLGGAGGGAALGGGDYPIEQPARWMQQMAPYVKYLCRFLKYTMPLVTPGLAKLAPDIEKVIGNDLRLMGELVKKLPEIESPELGMGLRSREKFMPDVRAVEGMELRALRSLLDKQDPERNWGGLSKVRTPEGHYLWLCPYHREEYRR